MFVPSRNSDRIPGLPELPGLKVLGMASTDEEVGKSCHQPLPSNQGTGLGFWPSKYEEALLDQPTSYLVVKVWNPWFATNQNNGDVFKDWEPRTQYDLESTPRGMWLKVVSSPNGFHVSGLPMTHSEKQVVPALPDWLKEWREEWRPGRMDADFTEFWFFWVLLSFFF